MADGSREPNSPGLVLARPMLQDFAYLAARLAGADVEAAAGRAHRLAAAVLGHPGAIIPRAAMPA